MQRCALFLLLTILVACTDSSSSPPERRAVPHAPPLPTVDPTPTPTGDPVPGIDDGKLPQLGAEDSFEFGTWNIENFPKSARSVDLTRTVLKETAVDLMAFEEVADEVAFQQLLDALPGYGSVLSPHQYGSNDYQKLAFIYREADLDLINWELLFPKETYAFPRPPLQAHFKIKTGSRAGHGIYMIAVHLKAAMKGNSQQRREAANKALESHVADLLQQEPEAQVILLGDFNETVTYAAGLNVFRPWTDRPESYSFQTKDMAMAGEYTFISPSRPMLDHMISTRNIELNPITVPKLETLIPDYRDLVSDHLPVVARLP